MEPENKQGRFSKQSANDHSNYVSFLRGSGIVMIGMCSKILLVFAAEVIAARILLPERYGLITWGLFVINIISMMTGLGLNTALRRFLPIYQSQGDQASVRGTILMSGMFSVIGGILGGLLLFVGAGWLAGTVMGDSRETMILLTFVFAVPLWNMQKIMLAVFSGFKRPIYKVLVEDIFVPAGFLIVVISAWAMEWKEVPIARGYVLVYLISAVLSIIFMRIKTPYRETLHVAPQYHTKEILKFSWPLIFTEPLGKITGLIDVLIIGILTTTYTVGVYRTASDMAVIMSMILMVFGFMYLPMVSEFVVKKDYSQWQDMNARVARWSMLITFPIFATFFFFSEEVINLVYGYQYSDAAPVLRILAVAYFGHAMVGFTGLNLAAAGMTGVQLAVHIASLAINIGGNCFLIPRYGVQGAAVATLVSLLVKNGVLLILTRWHLGFHPFTRLYLQSLGILLLFAFGCSFIIGLCSFLTNTIMLIIFDLLCFGFLSLLLCKGYLIEKTDMDIIRSFFKSSTHKLQNN